MKTLNPSLHDKFPVFWNTPFILKGSKWLPLVSGNQPTSVRIHEPRSSRTRTASPGETAGVVLSCTAATWLLRAGYETGPKNTESLLVPLLQKIKQPYYQTLRIIGAAVLGMYKAILFRGTGAVIHLLFHCRPIPNLLSHLQLKSHHAILHGASNLKSCPNMFTQTLPNKLWMCLFLNAVLRIHSWQG